MGWVEDAEWIGDFLHDLLVRPVSETYREALERSI